MSTTNPSGYRQPARTKVIVVGAGFSGLSVAYHLLKYSDEQFDVQILEARHRVGGRVYPLELGGGTIVDLGGQWVHEASMKNPICQLMKELEIPFHSEPSKTVKTNNVVFAQDGKKIDGTTVRSASRFLYKALDNYRKEDIQINTSFQDLLDREMTTSSESCTSSAFLQVLNHKRHQIACYEGSCLKELSVHLEDMYQHLGGPNEYPEGGYNNVLNRVVAMVGLDKIRFGCIVESIAYYDTGSNVDSVKLTVKHTANNDTASRDIVYGDYCVCTVPLGVLQKRAISFSPELPRARWDAIDAIGMGLLNKIVLKFDHRFWPSDYETFGAAHSDPVRVKSFVDCSSEVGAPVLMVFLGGDAARRVDSVDGLNDDDAVAEAMATLRSIFCKAVVPDPVAFAVTWWHTDPFAFGAYSFAKVCCTEDAYEQVAAPIGPLLFAGEHTSKTSHSTVHGAWESGRREAKRLLVSLQTRIK